MRCLLFCPHAVAFFERFAAEGARHMARRPFGLAEASLPSGDRRRIDMFKKSSFSELCLLPTWWLLRGRRTRSHSEPGREMPQRQWYFVSRRGRVGRRQVCKRQNILKSRNHRHQPMTGRKSSRFQGQCGVEQPPPTRRRLKASEDRQNKDPGDTRNAHKQRGVEQPGSSSGS